MKDTCQIKIKSSCSIFGGTLQIEALMKKVEVPRENRTVGEGLWCGTTKIVLNPTGRVLLKISQHDNKEACISVDIAELEKVISAIKDISTKLPN